MKVIDLLNRIANGEETFFETKLNDKCVVVKYYNDRNFSSSTGPEMLTIADIIKSLNNEVEILEEEKKIPEKLKILNANEHSKEVYYENYSKEEISLDIETLQSWVNKIIDYLDYLKSKGE